MRLRCEMRADVEAGWVESRGGEAAGKLWPEETGVAGEMACAVFFQAEDGIRDYKVTGVKTCALPICKGAMADRTTVKVAPLSLPSLMTPMVPPCKSSNDLTIESPSPKPPKRRVTDGSPC